ncbi:MAG: ISL3 family transposase [bacterium]|nr:ISL3 family transposase [bacterium]
MSSDVMRVRLHLRRVRVLVVVSDAPFELVVEVESAVRRPRCPECGFACSSVRDVRSKRVRDLEVSGRTVVLLWRRPRMACGGCCGRFLEDHPVFEGALTARLARRLVADARVMPIRRVARRHKIGWHKIGWHKIGWHKIGWHKINALVGAWAALVAARRRSRSCRVLSVDETSMRKRHRYVTVIVNADTGQTLAMVPHRSAAALSGFFASQGRKWCKQVKIVVTDGSPAYRSAIATHLGHARHVLDRFHVIRWFSAGLTAVRRDVQRRQPGGPQPAFDPQVFKARFALLKRADTLTGTDRARLDEIFDAHPRLEAAWQALQQLRGLYDADDHHRALHLDNFSDLYQTGQLPEFHDIVNTFIEWSDEILNWHHTGRPSNGRIEGTNNLLQVLRRTAHGFTNPHNFQARGLQIT